MSRVSLGIAAEVFELIARDNLPMQFNVGDIYSAQIPPPNTKNDNAASRKRQAKKRKSAKARGKK